MSESQAYLRIQAGREYPRVVELVGRGSVHLSAIKLLGPHLTADNHKANSRYIPRAVIRAVHQRDEGQCTFVSSGGNHCSERGSLDLHHHDVPYAKGGAATLENLRLVCRSHNASASVDATRPGVAGRGHYGRRPDQRHQAPASPAAANEATAQRRRHAPPNQQAARSRTAPRTSIAPSLA
jgi:hypothetical protein